MSVISAASFTSPYTKFQAQQTTFKTYLAVSCCTAFIWAVLCLRCLPSLCPTNSYLSVRPNSNFISSLTTLFLVPMYDRTYHIILYIIFLVGLSYCARFFERTENILFIFYVPSAHMCLAHSGIEQTFVNEHINNWVIKEKVDLFRDYS